MTRVANTETKRLIQERLFQTIAASLVRQLAAKGCHWCEIVDLANEFLEEILKLQDGDRGGQNDEPSAQALSAESKFVPMSSEAQVLSTQGRADLDERIYVRWPTDADKQTLARWRTDRAVSADLSINTLESLLGSDWIADHEGGREAFLCLCRNSDQQVIGLVGLTNIDRQIRQAELVKMIGDPSERGKGYAKGHTHRRYVWI